MCQSNPLHLAAQTFETFWFGLAALENHDNQA